MTLLSNNQTSPWTASYELDVNGFRIFVFGKEYVVKYPHEVYADLSDDIRRRLAENFIYCRVASLLLTIDRPFMYPFSRPPVRDFVTYGINGDIPRLSYLSGLSSDDLRLVLTQNQSRESFNDSSTNSSFEYDAVDRMVLAMSFGKDSLLTYGVTRELGLDIKLIYVREMEGIYAREEEFKSQIIDEFTKNEHVTLEVLMDNTDEMFVDIPGDRVIEDVENANGMLAFALQLMPFAYHYRARYILFGNEANFSDFFLLQDERVYPSFDQSIVYAQKENEVLAAITKGSTQVASLVESIYNIGEMAVLVNRYPDLIRYLMSCSPQEGDPDRWCYRCPMCAKAFLYLTAVGGNPQDMGFHQDFFEAQYAALYPLFNTDIKRAYEKPPAVRDEQLFAFLLAYRRGRTGELIDMFKELYLTEALEREVELREKFLGIHPSPTIPEALQEKIAALYRSELEKI